MSRFAMAGLTGSIAVMLGSLVTLVSIGKIILHFNSTFTTGFFDYYISMLGVIMALALFHVVEKGTVPEVRTLAILTVMAALIKIITDWQDWLDVFVLSVPILLAALWLLRMGRKNP